MRLLSLIIVPLALMLFVWLSPLAFVPVPWPDDSAFYFVAKDFFQWPPRWVMLPQAPFEPTYTIWNFNTMPLYPLLLGLGRFVGIDGSFALKFWPLGFWMLAGITLGVGLFRARMPYWLALLVSLGFMLDPALRWSSVLVRPESLIAACGMALVLGLTFGFPRRFQERGLFDPVAALLAIGAYAHFNAVHLLFPVVAAYWRRPRKLVTIALNTALYLVPWLMTVAWRPKLFWHQMTTQWTRLAVGNPWLNTWESALRSLFQEMGSPDPWPSYLIWASGLLWALMILAMGVLALSVFRGKSRASRGIDLAPASAWVLGSIWLWHNKPEVWFVHYIHAAVWCFAGVLLLKAWQNRARLWEGLVPLYALGATAAALVLMFASTDISQARSLAQSPSWKWSSYEELIDCIDRQLIGLHERLGRPKPFRVWDPTFPDVIIELSRRHPDWEFTRTNDFWERRDKAIRHGHEVEAVVVPETLSHAERWIDERSSARPDIVSVWMTWDGYFLKYLWNDPAWVRDRHICQVGRWQAFLFMKPVSRK